MFPPNTTTTECIRNSPALRWLISPGAKEHVCREELEDNQTVCNFVETALWGYWNERQALVRRVRQTTLNIPVLLCIGSGTLDGYLISLSLIFPLCKMGIRILTSLSSFNL